MSEKNDSMDELPSRELPLSTVENTPPLMLDLPDGQQLVVGKLPDGIVIEIATWRGTGRPDSRTNRMMLGVSYDEDELEEKPKRAILKRIRHEEAKDSDSKNNLAVVETPEVENTNNESSFSEPEVAPVVTVTHEEVPTEMIIETEVSTPANDVIEAVETSELIPIAEIENELVEIDVTQEIEAIASDEVPVFKAVETPSTGRNMQDLMGARPRARLNEQPGASMMDRGHEIVRRPSNKKRSLSFQYKSLIKPLAASALAVLGISLLIGPAGVRFTLPEGGLRTSMSSAQNALVIVRESSDYQIGDTVVAAIQTESKPDFFASIAAQSDVEYVLTENNLYHTALREDVKGKVILVMPGIGFILHKLGL
jgi:hypothetical protein